MGSHTETLRDRWTGKERGHFLTRKGNEDMSSTSEPRKPDSPCVTSAAAQALLREKRIIIGGWLEKQADASGELKVDGVRYDGLREGINLAFDWFADFGTFGDGFTAALDKAAGVIETTEMYGSTPEHPGVCYTSAAWRKQIAAAIRSLADKSEATTSDAHGTEDSGSRC